VYLVLCTTSRDHACASWRRSRSRSSTSHTSATFPSRHGTPRRIRIRSLALPLINQASHALIRLLGRRRRRRRLLTRRGINGRDGAYRDWPHRNIESTSTAAAGSSNIGLLFRRATPAAIRRRRFPLHRETRKTDRGGAFCARLVVRNAEARRWLLRRVCRESG
jgi:hypothetical protein